MRLIYLSVYFNVFDTAHVPTLILRLAKVGPTLNKHREKGLPFANLLAQQGGFASADVAVIATKGRNFRNIRSALLAMCTQGGIMSEKLSSDQLSVAIVQNALRVFAREEIPFLPRRAFRDFLALIALRLDRCPIAPTRAELEGLRELAFEDLQCAAVTHNATRTAARKGQGTGEHDKIGWLIAASVVRSVA